MGKTPVRQALEELGFTEIPGFNKYCMKNTDIRVLLFHKRIGIRVVITAGLDDRFYRTMDTDKDGNVTDEQKAHMKTAIVKYMLGESI